MALLNVSTDTVFYTQLGTILLFIISLFVLYRMLVQVLEGTIHQKDATIEFLRIQLEKTKEETPDKLLQQISDRLRFAEEEVERLSADKQKAEGHKAALVELVRLQHEMIEAQKAISEHQEKRLGDVSRIITNWQSYRAALAGK
jgi:hypothetical protein